MNIHKRASSSHANSNAKIAKSQTGVMRRRGRARKYSKAEFLLLLFLFFVFVILIGVYFKQALPLLLASSQHPSSSSSSSTVSTSTQKKAQAAKHKRNHKDALRQLHLHDQAIIIGDVKEKHAMGGKNKHNEERMKALKEKAKRALDPPSESEEVAYKHSDFMEKVGDHSDRYVELRKRYDQLLPHTDPKDIQRMKEFVTQLKKNTYTTILPNDMNYDIHNCPTDPPPHYPKAWNVRQVLENWPPDDTNPQTPQYQIYQGLCIFNYDSEDDLEKAHTYRRAELPFIVRNDPKVLRSVERWNQPNYMFKLFGDGSRYRTEHSVNNHFMYWRNVNKKKKGNNEFKEWKPPTDVEKITFEEWFAHANVTNDSDADMKGRDDDILGPNNEHWYFIPSSCSNMERAACPKNAEFLYDELPFFQGTPTNSLYMVDPKEQKGIFCRFGMNGAIAENHFDGTRNTIALLGGERRYILAHPDQCENMELYPKNHPSGRHSAVDWSEPDWETFKNFQHVEVNEVVLQAGDVLYLPTNWFHYIISLGLNYQCNTRSGVSHEYDDAMKACGFETHYLNTQEKRRPDRPGRHNMGNNHQRNHQAAAK